MAHKPKKMFLAITVLLICLIALWHPLAAESTTGKGIKGINTVYAETNDNFQSRVGVASSHLPLWDKGKIDSQLDAMKSAGIGWIRTCIMWCDMEPVEGSWNFSGADYAVDAASSRGINVLGILGGPPGWANGTSPTNPWYPPTDIEAWQNYVTTVCTRYKGKVQAWEIWNEENIGFWQPAPDPAAYVTLLSQTTPSIRAADPEATIVMGGMAGLGSAFLDSSLKAGAADYIDAIAYHPYTWTLTQNDYSPQEVKCRELVGWVRNLLSVYTTKDIRIWLTEFGWTSCSASPPGVDESTQAAYLLRSLISYATTEVDKIIWYNLWNEMDNPDDPEANFGLLNNNFSPKDSYKYYETFIDTLGDCTGAMGNIINILCANPSTLELYAFKKPGGGNVVTAWKTDDINDEITFTLNTGDLEDPVSINPLTGSSSAVPGISRSSEGIIVSGLMAGKTPVILKFDPVVPHIDSLSDYFKNAGDPAFNLTLNGSGFSPSSVVNWNGSQRTTNYLSPTNITAEITAEDLLNAGTYCITVENTSTGAISELVEFSVDNWITWLIRQFLNAWNELVRFILWLINPFGF